MFILITWLNIVFLTNLKPKVWFVGADLYDDVQNPLSKNLRHCHQSQFWWGIPPSFPLLYTPLIVHKRFCKKKKKQPLIKTINQKSNEIFFHVKFMNIFSRYKVSCCTSGRGCRNTWWRSWTRRRQYCWWECATRCCTRPSLTSSCRPCFRRYLTGECRLINFICYSFFTMVGSSANFHFVLT